MKTKEEILEYIEDIDLSLMLLEDTMKGQIGDAITKARGQLEDVRKYHASQFQQEWIPVEDKERLPNDPKFVWGTLDTGEVARVFYTNKKWFLSTNTSFSVNVIAHQSIIKPQPYNPTKS